MASERWPLAFLEPVLQDLDVNRKVPPFRGAAFMDDARYPVASIEERSAGHALRQLLRHLDEPDGALDGEGGDEAGSDVEAVSGRPTGISNRGRGIASRDRTRHGIKLEIFGCRNPVLE